jgi:YggT family protein
VLLIIALIQILRIGIDIIFYSVIGSVILSWVSPEKTNPALELIDEISNKVLSPVRNFIPSAGGIDFSPIVIFIAISMISSFLQDIIRSIA